MQPVELILSALTAGALAGLTDVAGSAVKDTYKALVKLVSQKLGSAPAGKSSLNGYLKDPETWEKPVKKAIQERKIDEDAKVLSLAKELLAAINSQIELSKYHVEITGDVQGFVQGNNARVTMNFNKPVPEPNSKQNKKKGK